MLSPSNTPQDLFFLSQEYRSIKKSGTWLHTFSEAPQSLLFHGEFILLLHNQLPRFQHLETTQYLAVSAGRVRAQLN